MKPKIPEPTIDQEPDEGELAGGADAIDPHAPFPPVTPDPPLAAHLSDEVPDAVREPEESDRDADTGDPSKEPTD